jgi:hypothetical protein
LNSDETGAASDGGDTASRNKHAATMVLTAMKAPGS